MTEISIPAHDPPQANRDEQDRERLDALYDYFHLVEHLGNRPNAYAARRAHYVRAIPAERVPGLYKARSAGQISDRDFDAVLESDAILRSRKPRTRSRAYIPVFVRPAISVTTVQRALHAATTLRQLGLNTDPMVFGRIIGPEAAIVAAANGVTVGIYLAWKLDDPHKQWLRHFPPVQDYELAY